MLCGYHWMSENQTQKKRDRIKYTKIPMAFVTGTGIANIRLLSIGSPMDVVTYFKTKGQSEKERQSAGKQAVPALQGVTQHPCVL